MQNIVRMECGEAILGQSVAEENRTEKTCIKVRGSLTNYELLWVPDLPPSLYSDLGGRVGPLLPG